MSKSDSNKEKTKEIMDKLEQGVKDVFTNENYTNYLRAVSKFHNYSVNNVILICMQKPDASYVAGYNKWKTEFGRQVKSGEKGISIIAPIVYKNKDSEDEEDVALFFRRATVFDISQTEGEDFPEYVRKLEGTIENYQSLYEAVTDYSPVPITIEEIKGTVNGFYDSKTEKITVASGMSEMQTLKTTLHEIAHANIHAEKGADKRTREVQAESVAYVVCQHYGLDTSDYSFGYVAGWSSGKEVKELKASLDIISKASLEIIEGIDKNYKKEKEPENSLELVAKEEREASKEISASQIETKDIRMER